VIGTQACHHIVTGATTYRQASCKVRVDVARRGVAFRCDALLQTRGGRRENETQDLRRRTRDRAALGFEGASATGSHTVLREQAIVI